jgi:hypothetical protein
MTCYFLIAFYMTRLEAAVGIQHRVGRSLLSLGYYVAVFLALALVSLMVKIVARHHAA